MRFSRASSGCWRDNVFVERPWRTIKYEHVYLRAYDCVIDARAQLGQFIQFYNTQRPHSSLDKKTPTSSTSHRCRRSTGSLTARVPFMGHRFRVQTPVASSVRPGMPTPNIINWQAIRTARAGIVLFGFVLASNASYAVDYLTSPGYNVDTIRSPDGRPCTFFTLVGVGQADPVVANSPWFVISQSAVGYKEMLAMLITAKSTGRPVYLSTTGKTVAACGQAEVYVLMMP
jgi:putative transposase